MPTSPNGPEPEISQERQPVLNVPWIVLAAIAVLVVVHGALNWLGPDWQVWSHYAFSFIPVRLGGGPPIAAPPGAALWSFLSYGFLHGDVYHLGSNCIWLLIFSTPVARRLGVARYLALLALTTIAGAVAMLVMYWGAFIVVVGASAAVAGTMAAASPIMFALGFSRQADPSTQPALNFGALLRNRQALIFMAVFIALQLVTGTSMFMTGTAFLEERVIAWEAHIGGFVAGLLSFYLLDRGPRL